MESLLDREEMRTVLQFGFALAIALVAAGAETARAHQPYAKVIGELRAENAGEFLIEALYGDGIFGPDPLRVQVVSREGEVFAVTEVQRGGGRAAARCPSVDNCLVTIVRHAMLLPTTYRLDAGSIDQPLVAVTSREYPEFSQARQVGFRRAPGQNLVIRLWSGISLTADLLIASVLATLPFGALVYGAVRSVQVTRRWAVRIPLLAIVPPVVAGYALGTGFFLMSVLGAPATVLFLLYLYGMALAIAAAVMPPRDPVAAA